MSNDGATAADDQSNVGNFLSGCKLSKDEQKKHNHSKRATNTSVE